MSTCPTDSLKVVFMAFGQSPAIGQLPKQLGGSVQECTAVGDISPRTNKPAAQYFISLDLFARSENDKATLEQIEAWLRKHAELLSNVDARKIIEFQTCLDSQTGSRIVTIPNPIVRLCGEAGLDLAHQAIRVLSESEYEELRGDPAS